MNLNPNLSEDILKFLLLESLKNYNTNKELSELDCEVSNINELVLANISLGFIYKPELTFKILKSEKVNEETGYSTLFEKNVAIMYNYLNIKYNEYDILLNKCIILGLCGLFSNQFCLEKLGDNKNMKLILLQLFYKFVFIHKRELTLKL